jgi:hypothetical protein
LRPVEYSLTTAQANAKIECCKAVNACNSVLEHLLHPSDAVNNKIIQAQQKRTQVMLDGVSFISEVRECYSVEHGNSIKIGCEGILVLWLAAVEAFALAAVQRCVAGLLNGLCLNRSSFFLYLRLLPQKIQANTAFR